MLTLHVFFVVVSSSFVIYADENEELRASEFHDKVFEPQNVEWLHRLSLASWNYESNLTTENWKILNEVTLRMRDFEEESFKVFRSYDWRSFQNETLKRLFYLNSDLGNSALDKKQFKELTEVLLNMTTIYTKTTVCDYHNRKKCDLPLNPDVLHVMATSRDYNELQFMWEEWHNKCGRKIKNIYSRYVTLMNEAANLNGYKSNAEKWINKFHSDTFEKNIDEIWEALLPYYKELHAFVRRKLIGLYGEDKIRPDGPIPIHVLGDQWGQIWSPLYNLVVPFPEKETLDVTDALKEKGYTAVEMFELADSFYQSLGLKEVPESFWRLSILTRPHDRNILCHATAWDLGYDDVRIRMCSRIQMDDLIAMHHELGHIQYYLQYRNLPSTFKRSANPGFHEAIGDTISLSVGTPKHLMAIELLDRFDDNEEFDINFLMLKALEKLAALPFAYLVDKYRWALFRGEITPDNSNSKWWEMSKAFQGVEPPGLRTEEDFDAGTKMHVASNYPFIRYFVSTLLQFQFHETLCRVADQYDPNNILMPLHKCDIYGNRQAGEKFGNMLRKGQSEPWGRTLEEFTGTSRIDPSSMINFFSPLFKYIKKVNKKNNEYIGWREKKDNDFNEGRSNKNTEFMERKEEKNNEWRIKKKTSWIGLPIKRQGYKRNTQHHHNIYI